MAPEEFDALVADNFAAAQRDPVGSRARVIRLALVGYAYIAVLVVATARVRPEHACTRSAAEAPAALTGVLS